MKKIKVILDIDPGVDDTLCFVASLCNSSLDVLLATIEDGNIPIEQTIKNTMFLLKCTNKTCKVVAGKKFAKRTDKEGRAAQKRAEEMHGKKSLGGIMVPNDNYPKPVEQDVADAMYEVLKQHPKQVTILGCAPLTNIAYLFDKYPDSVKLVKQVIFMGGSFGVPGKPDHISYNAGANPFAYNKVVHSGVSCVVVQSKIGRTKARFTKEQVDKIATLGPYGKFLTQMFETYWEKGFEEKFVANNDICTYLYLIHPEFFKTQRVDIIVDLVDKPGKLSKQPNPKSHINLIIDLDRRKFLDFMFDHIKSLTKFNF